MNYDFAIHFIDKDAIKSIFELGARDCKDSITLQKRYNCPVYAFECNPDGLRLCHETLKGVNLPIELIEMAVNSYDGVTSFYPIKAAKDSNIGASSLFHFKRDNSVQTSITVPCCRLDTFIRDRGVRVPELICMDIQGGELNAMKSMGEYIRDVRYVATECSIEGAYEDSYTFKDMYTFMTGEGFELVGSPYNRRDVVRFLEGRTDGLVETDFIWERT